MSEISSPGFSSAQKAMQIDPISLKKSLDEVLGINREKYWLSIQSFIKGEINKNELDFRVRFLLPKEHVHLHDEFIRASIKLKNMRKNQNCAKSLTPSIALSQKERSLKKIISSMEKKERNKLHIILESAQNKGESHTNSNLILFEKKFPKNTIINDGLIDLPTMRSSKTAINEREEEFSIFDSVYTKMMEIALDNGLIGGVSEDCANLMIHALETYLKNIVYSCINKIRSSDFHNGKEKISNSPISLSDLALSLEISPYVLVENNYILERILNKIKRKL